MQSVPRAGLRRLAMIAALALSAIACGAQQASTQQAKQDPGVTSSEIVLGATYPLSGSASYYYAIAKGATAYFKSVNDKGGVNGRKITYKVVDDGYNPANTPGKTRELVEQEKIFASFGNLGSPTNTSVRDYYNENRVPQLFVFTGASQWGGQYEKYPYTLGWQPDYQSEAKIYAKYILQNQPGAKIGVLYQNDVYGQDYLNGMKAGLGDKASLIVSTATYNAGDPVDMKSQVTTLKNSGADTFFVVTTPAYSASALVAMANLGWKPKVYLNDVGASAVTMLGVVKTLGRSEAIDGMISSQYLKDPSDPQWANDKGIQQYRDLLARYGDGCEVKDNFCVAGMASAFTMVDVLKKAGSNLTRKNVVDIAATQLNESDNFLLLPGITVKTSKTSHFPITQERLQRWETDHWVPFGEVVSSRG